MTTVSTATPDRRAVWFALGLILTGVALAQAFRQEVRANPFAPRDWWSWFAQPSEVNAEARLPELIGDLYGVHVSADGKTIWVVGASRTVSVSRDSGRNWSKIDLPKFPNEGVIVPPPEKPKQKSQVAPIDPRIFAMQAPPKYVEPPPVVAVFVAPPTGSALTAVSFTPDGREGWIVGPHGVIFHSEDAGESWQPIRVVAKRPSETKAKDPADFHLIAVRAMLGGNAAMADNMGCLFEYSHTAKTWVWTVDGSFPTGGAWIGADGLPWFGERTNQKLVDRLGDERSLAIATYAGNPRKREPIAKAPGNLWAITSTPQGVHWCAGDGGTIAKIAGGSARRQQVTDTVDGKARELRAIAFADEQRGAVGGDGPTAAFTDDSGETWKLASLQIPSGPPQQQSIRAIAFAGSDSWAIGTQGLLLRSADAGKSWKSFTRPESASGSTIFVPAPWLLLALLTSLVCFLQALRRVYEAPVEAIDDSLTADRPLEPGDVDVIGLGRIAKALSRFLRNENTLPPLTAAVVGKWGTGKSSLMNLLKKDLEAIGFSPVWFNAWHHSTKNEDQLLAGLLANVIRQGIPPWFSIAGVSFRSKLVWARMRRLWLRLLIGAALTAAAIAHFGNPKALETVNFDKLLSALAGRPEPPNEKSILFGVSGLAGLAVFARSARQSLQSFGVDGGALLASVTSRANLSALDAKASFRLTFATQFREVTAALNPRTLVVFIDDLDRCRPENVLEIMESINFLSSSGDCFIFLGMDWDYVHKSVALGFEKVADAMVESRPGSPDARANQLKFAASYLEKLVNFEVPIPTTDALKRQEFLLPKPADVSAVKPTRLFELARWRNHLATAAMIGLLIAVPIAVYEWMTPASRSTDGKSTASPHNKANETIAAALQANGRPDMPLLPDNPATDFRPAERSASTPIFWVLVGLTGVMMGIGVFGLLRRPSVVVRDSSEFTKALRLWLGQVTAKRETARSLKQFINRLRYCAMRMRVEEREPNRWERLLAALGLRRNKAAATGADSPEADLVQWSVLREICPAALNGDKELPKEIAKLMKEHREKFQRDAGKREVDRTLFRELSEGFRT